MRNGNFRGWRILRSWKLWELWQPGHACRQPGWFRCTCSGSRIRKCAASGEPGRRPSIALRVMRHAIAMTHGCSCAVAASWYASALRPASRQGGRATSAWSEQCGPAWRAGEQTESRNLKVCLVCSRMAGHSTERVRHAYEPLYNGSEPQGVLRGGAGSFREQVGGRKARPTSYRNNSGLKRAQQWHIRM